MKILSMSGFIPEQICDTVRFTQYPGERNISHYCGYASDFISQVKHDDNIDGAVFPKSCDSSRIMSSYLGNSGKFVYQLNIPARQDDFAVEYFASIIINYKKALEEYYQISINDVTERAEIINERNDKLKKIYSDIESISYIEYLSSIHNMLKLPLADQRVPTVFTKKKTSNKRVFLVGSFLSNCQIIDSIENYGMTVVGDNLTESGRLVSRRKVNVNGDIYKEIAASILRARLSPTQNNFKEVLSNDLNEIKEKGVNGVIFVTQKYCEPYDYMFSVYKKLLDDIGIPTLKITMSDSEDSKKLDLLLETFSDMI